MKKNECRHFTDSVMYALEQTAVYGRVKAAQMFTELGIPVTSEQYITLDAISMNPDICQRDLAKIILKDRSNTGRILTILEQNEYIERKAETKGKRLVRKIYITEKGKNIIEQYQLKLNQAFYKVFEEITEDEFDTIKQILAKMKNCLSKETTLQI